MSSMPARPLASKPSTRIRSNSRAGLRDVVVAVGDFDDHPLESSGSLKNWRAAATTAGSISTTVSAACGRLRYRNLVIDAAPSPICSTCRGHRRPGRSSSESIISRVYSSSSAYGPRDAHRALYPVRAEVQRAHPVFLADFDGCGHGSRQSPGAGHRNVGGMHFEQVVHRRGDFHVIENTMEPCFHHRYERYNSSQVERKSADTDALGLPAYR